ncbi:hypothetical protein [Agrobacterium vitis]|uniref:hypothetical protein n=1 Tax=Agrobacterium vitis TaxID=373 RepID=UPI003D2A8E3F
MHGLIAYRKRKRAGWQLVILFVFSFFTMAYTFGRDFTEWSNTSAGQQALSRWFGGKSLFDLVSSAVTMISAVVAGFLAFRSYETNRRAAIANRYQKGVELLAASEDSSKLGGIELLSIAAAEAPKEYQVPVIRTLRQFLQERCSPKIRAILTEVPATEVAADTDFVVMSSLSAIARTDIRHRWMLRQYDDDGLPLYGICLDQMHFIHLNFSKLRFVEAILGDVIFESCTFHETLMNIICTGEIVFKDCTFTNTEIVTVDIIGNQLDNAKSFIRMSGSQRALLSRINGSWIQ